MRRSAYTWRTFGLELLLLVVAVVFFVPFYVAAAISLKSASDVYSKPLAFPSNPDFSGYRTAWHGNASSSLGHSLVNSIVITGASVVGLVVIGSLAAYALARRPSRMSTLLYVLFLLGLIVPFQLGIVPLYVALRHLHLNQQYGGMILLYIGLLMPLSVFLYTGFIRALPRDYEEASYVDGASSLRTFLRIVFPLLRPVTGTVIVLSAILIWNDFFTQLIFLSGSRQQTLPVAIYSFVGEYVSQWNQIFAAVIISILPILAFYVVAQRQLIRGFAGGVKG